MILVFGGKYQGKTEFARELDREPETGEAVRRALLDIYLSKNKYEDAVALLKQLGDKATDKEKEAANKVKYNAEIGKQPP